MLTRRPLSLRARLAALLGALFLFGMVALYLAARSYGHLAADGSFDRVLAGSVISIAETLSVTRDEVSVDIPYAALDMLSAAPDDRVFYRVSGPGDRTVTGYDDLPRPDRSQPLLGDVSGESPRFFDALYRGEPVRFALIGRQIAQAGSQGWVWVQVGQTRLARDAVARETIVRALLPIVAMTMLALVLVWFGITSALRPLKSIGDELSERRPADLHPIDAHVPDEIRPLADAINGFMRRLGENIDTLKGFIADASHQMRTPLAALLAQAHVAGDDPEELRRSLEAVERNGRKLAHLLNQLLSDATVAHLADVRRFGQVDLLDVLPEAIRDTVHRLEENDVRLTTSLARAPVLGDRLMLAEAFKNLIHNAVRHGAGDLHQTDVRLFEVERNYVVSIADRGPGIAPDDRERVFERFARGRTDAAGAGIGLAIVRQAVGSHNGTIRLLDRAGGGLTVVVTLPRSGA